MIPYSSVYGIPPSRLVFTGPVGSCKIRLVSRRADSFAGSANASRPPPPPKPRPKREHAERTQQLRDALCNGSKWGTDSASSVDSAVKAQERLDNPGETLTELQATTFRALAARANYLARDRPDVAFSLRKLCRAFSRPTSSDVLALKHLVRYLVHRPLICYRFAHQKQASSLRVCVDTDFAGCVSTRRSTSGAMIVWAII